MEKIKVPSLENLETLVEITSLIESSNRILVLTGAGVSAESGIETFRHGGLWDKIDPKYFLRPESLETRPEELLRFYEERRVEIQSKEPNFWHFFLKDLTTRKEAKILTQNIDDLHEKAGTMPIHVHGKINKAYCVSCRKRFEGVSYSNKNRCDECRGLIRPDVVMFKENLKPYEANPEDFDLLLCVGTSLEVYPIAFLPEFFKKAGKKTAWIGLHEPKDSKHLDFIGYADSTIFHAAMLIYKSDTL